MSLTDNTAQSLSIEQAGKPDLLIETQSNSSTNLGSPSLSFDFLPSFSENLLSFDKSEPQLECKMMTVCDFDVTLNFKNICKRLGFGTIVHNQVGEEVLQVNFRYPRAIILVDSKGKATCSNVEDFEVAREAIEKLGRYFVRLGYKVKAGNARIASLKVYMDLKTDLKLGAISRKFPIQKFLFYEPEIFPSMMITMEDLKVKVVVHENGLIEAKGSKNEKQSREAVLRVTNWISENWFTLF